MEIGPQIVVMKPIYCWVLHKITVSLHVYSKYQMSKYHCWLWAGLPSEPLIAVGMKVYNNYTYYICISKQILDSFLCNLAYVAPR
jgi:hypothetical protein